MTPKNEIEHGICSYCGADRSGPSAEAHEPNCLYAEPEPVAPSVGARELLKCATNWRQEHNSFWTDESVAAFASSIQAEGRQDYLSLTKVHREFLRQVRKAGVKVDLYSLALQTDLINERAESAEQQLAEARALGRKAGDDNASPALCNLPAIRLGNPSSPAVPEKNGAGAPSWP